MQILKNTWHKLNEAVAFVERWTLTVLFIGMLICGALQIVARFILHTPIPWSEELLTYSFVWTSFLGASLAINSLSHFNVDVLVVRLPTKISHPLLYLVWTIMAVFTVFLFYKGLVLTQVNVYQTMDVIPISMFWAYLALPVSSAFMFVHTIERLILGDFLPHMRVMIHVPVEEGV
ncbi:MAG: TRAP-type C4-dicarboxylate transport system permease small subunit [Desulforhopalus sp.]|jgi:TRAP-type C4-dicarboxylate transport system permease small subunit